MMALPSGVPFVTRHTLQALGIKIIKRNEKHLFVVLVPWSPKRK